MSDNEQENEKRETVADIVAWMRYGTIPKHRRDSELLAIYADRIEAAWKREARAIATENAVLPAVCITKPSGNAAAMREALEYANNELLRATEDDRYGDDVVYLVGCMRTVAAVCRAALSTPARNCDVYKNKKDAESAFISVECKHPCGNCTVNDEYGCALVHECGVDWLFAPATERKG